MSAKVKAITTIIEDDVVFMTDPEVTYVSLVKHGANRTPFKILKTEKLKEEEGMEKVVQSILVRNDLPEEEIAKALEGMSKKEQKNTGTITAFTQLPLSRCDESTLMVVKDESVDGVYRVLADLNEDQNEAGTLLVEVGKEAVDYATLDNLYTELYAMADIVSGAMRQENAASEFRKSTIISAIDNFRTFAEVVLNNLGAAEKNEMAVKLEDHPTLVYPLVKTEEMVKAEEAAAAAEEAVAATVEAVAEEAVNEAVEEAPVEGEATEKIGELVCATIEESFKKIATGLETVLSTINDNVTTSLKAVKEDVEEIKLTTVSAKSEHDDDSRVTKKSTFKGVLFGG